MREIETIILEELEKSRKYSAYEAVPKSGNKIKVPNFHYVVYKNADNVWVGYCIDFDLTAYSKDTDANKAKQKIFNRLVNMVILYIATLIETEQLDTLYDNCNWGFSEKGWGNLFSSKFNENKIKILEESLEKFVVEISSSNEEIADDKVAIKAIYDELKQKKEEIQELNKRLMELMTQKGSNVVAFVPRELRLAVGQ